MYRPNSILSVCVMSTLTDNLFAVLLLFVRLYPNEHASPSSLPQGRGRDELGELSFDVSHSILPFRVLLFKVI